MFKTTTRFLIVDDFSTMRKVIKKALFDLGYENVIEAADGVKAFELLEKYSQTSEPVEIVMSDWNMPNMMGIDLLKKCRGDARFKSLPIMLITAESEQSQIVEAVKAGVSDYVIKPFSPSTLKGKLENVFKKSFPGSAA